MKKNVTARVLCLIIASVVLSGAVAFAAVTGSPYETLKKAAFDAVTYRNVTVESRMTLTINGEVWEDGISNYIAGDNAFIEYYYGENGEVSSFSYITDGLKISTDYIGINGTRWYHGYISSRNENYNWDGRGSLALFGPEDRDSARMRFMELVIDAFVGDLKNNVTMSSKNGVRTVRGAFEESQIPELVKTGLDMLIEQSTNSYYYYTDSISYGGGEEAFIDTPMKSVTINNVNGEADIDPDGNLLRIEGSCKVTLTNISGETGDIEVNISAHFSDIGTSEPVCPIPGAEQLLTPENMNALYWTGNIGVFFTLNADGSIDADSITTTYPGELDALGNEFVFSGDRLSPMPVDVEIAFPEG